MFDYCFFRSAIDQTDFINYVYQEFDHFIQQVSLNNKDYNTM